jgi:hypothetical protein
MKLKCSFEAVCGAPVLVNFTVILKGEHRQIKCHVSHKQVKDLVSKVSGYFRQEA